MIIRILIFLVMVTYTIITFGCAVITYEATDTDGRVVKGTYTRILTASDSIECKVGNASIKSAGQKVYDLETLQKALQIISGLE